MIDKDKIKHIHIILIYLPNNNKKEKLRIFGSEFIKNNKNKCKIIFNKREYKLKEYFEDVNHYYNHKKRIIIELIGKNIIDTSYMFSECKTLYKFYDLSEIKNLEGINRLKEEISQISILSNINNKSLTKSLSSNTDKTPDMYYGCLSSKIQYLKVMMKTK